MKICKIKPWFLIFFLLLIFPLTAKTQEIEVIGADTVLTLNLTSPPSDCLDSKDAPPQNLIKDAFVSHADSILTMEFEETPSLLIPQKWSFAIITDLHIGRGYPDYDSSGFDDSGDGEDYYLTERLKNVVQWIIDNRNNIDCGDTKCPIKFLAVLGDIADSAERSEFLKAKKILDRLNDYGIPYVPVFGNHDVWPHTDKEAATLTFGENYFDEIFWDENATNTKLMKEILNWQRDTQNPKYKNFAFNYGGINFIGLDFNSREKTIGGVKGEGVLHNETINWLKNKLNEWKGKEKVIIFSHEPFTKPHSRAFHSEWPPILPLPAGNFDKTEIETIKEILEGYENIFEGQQILATFGGHIHGFEKLGKEIINQLSPFDIFMDGNWQYPSLSTIPVITTEALMVGGNEEDLTNKGLVRIVKVNEKGKIDFSQTEVKIPALNPSISFDFKILPDQLYPCVYFRASLFSKRNFDSLLFDFGDGKTEILGFPQIATIHCYSPLKVPQTYKVELTAIDKETGKAESITKKVEIKEGIIPKVIKVAQDIKEKTEFILIELRENALEFGRTMREKVLIFTKPKSPQILIGIIDVHYENATEDIDLTQMKVDVDVEKKKSLLYMPEWPDLIEKEKILFISK
ncbi:MAG: metallophosphoesterase [Candidatus Pacearchaeota archaeon]